MKCDYYIQLIHLHRPGERTDEEDRVLKNHLSTCSACIQVAEEVNASGRIIQLAAKSSRLTPEPEPLTEQILERCTTQKQHFIRRPLVLWMYNYYTLAACTLLAILLAGAYVRESFQINQKILALEAKMGEKGRHAGPFNSWRAESKHTTSALSMIFSMASQSKMILLPEASQELRKIKQVLAIYNKLSPYHRRILAQQYYQVKTWNGSQPIIETSKGFH
jgi:hypothetical protein